MFGRKRPSGSLPKSTSKKIKLEAESKFHCKKITVLCVDNKVFSVPSRKVRDAIVKEGLVKEIYISKYETVFDVLERVKALFPKHTVYML